MSRQLFYYQEKNITFTARLITSTLGASGTRAMKSAIDKSAGAKFFD